MNDEYRVIRQLGLDPASATLAHDLRALYRQVHPDKCKHTSETVSQQQALLGRHWRQVMAFAEMPVTFRTGPRYASRVAQEPLSCASRTCAECATGVRCDLHCEGPCCIRPCPRERHFALLVRDTNNVLREYNCEAETHEVLEKLRQSRFAEIAAQLPPSTHIRAVPLERPPDRFAHNTWGVSFDMYIDQDLRVTLLCV